MRCRRLEIRSSIVFVLVLICFSFHVNATSYKSYIFDAWGRAVPTPQPYEPTSTIYGKDIGVGDLRNPQDLFLAPDDTLYIVDTRNNRIIRTTSDFTLIDIYQEFEHDGIVDTFNNPLGVFVTDEGHLFVADTNNGRIVRLDENGQYIMSIDSPDKDHPRAFPEYFQFRPSKVAVDQVDRLYVIASGLYEGLMELDIDGNFRTFMGAPRVSPTAWEYFWSRIATEEQRQRMTLFIPTELSNMDLNERGFIYTTVSGGEISVEQVIRQLNPSGSDVLRREGFHPPMGDINVGDHLLAFSEITGNSLLVDIVCRENGIYSVLDQRRGRIFTYDNNGNLLYVFGGVGQEVGLFTNPVALEQNGNQLLVLDNRSNSITVFEPTNYASLIHAAIDEYNQGFYDAAAEIWHQVISINANNELAYSGVADAHLRQGEYEQAMHYYKLANNREGYSEAFYRYRQQGIGDNFGTIMTGIIIFIVLIYLSIKQNWVQRLQTKYGNSQLAAAIADQRVQNNPIFAFLKRTWIAIKYLRHTSFHPYDGFWDLKYENSGTVAAANMILLFVVISFVFMRQYTGFVLNYMRIEDYNVVVEVISILVPFFLWCLVNWALTTLMEGKGKLKDIYIAGAYALSPLIFILIPITIISNFITIDEGTFFYLLLIIGVVWALSLLVIGTGVIHEYGFGKTLFTTAATIIGIGIVFFVALLFFNVTDRMIRFIQDIYIELAFRL